MTGQKESQHEDGGAEPFEGSGFRLVFLGLPAVERHQGPEYEQLFFPLKRALKILGLLAANKGYQATRDEIVEVIWPESSQEVIANNFHPTISLLRKSLQPEGRSWGSIVRLRNGVYGLDRDLDWQIDVSLFRNQLERGGALRSAGRPLEAFEAWQQAWRLYGGPFFRGYNDPWILAVREDLQRAYLRLLESLGDLAVELEDWTAAEDAYRSLQIEDSLQEHVYVALMTVYARRGRPDLVQRQFERLRSLLRSELGAEPSEATMLAYNECLR